MQDNNSSRDIMVVIKDQIWLDDMNKEKKK